MKIQKAKGEGVLKFDSMQEKYQCNLEMSAIGTLILNMNESMSIKCPKYEKSGIDFKWMN